MVHQLTVDYTIFINQGKQNLIKKKEKTGIKTFHMWNDSNKKAKITNLKETRLISNFEREKRGGGNNIYKA